MISASLKPLYLSESLESLSLGDLKRFAGLLGITPAQSSKARLIRDIPEALQTGISDKLSQQLSIHSINDLAVVLALGESGAFLGTSIRSNALSQLPTASTRLHPLLVDIEGNGDLRIFAEFFPGARRLCGALTHLKPTSVPDTKLVLPPETLINDIYSVWAALAKRPIKLTKKDTPKKRHLDGLIALLLVDEDEPGLASLQSYFATSRFELLFAFMQKQRVLRVNGGILESNPVFAERIAPELPQAGRILLEMVTSRGSAAAVALAVLLLKENDNWIDTADLLSRISDIATDCDISDVKNALFALFVSGYIAVGRKGRSILVRRERDFLPLPMDEFWAGETDIIVGSNFEIKVPANTEPSLRVKIDAFAELRKPDMFYDYEITKSSVYRALDDGISAAEIIAALRDYSKRPIPQNVEFAISNWERQFGAIGFEKGLFLVAGDKAAAEELAGLSGIIGGDGEVVEMFGIRLEESDYGRVRDNLRQMGFLPRSLPHTVQSRGGEGDVSTLFRGYRYGPKGPIVAGLDKQTVLKHGIEFARKKGGRIKLELRGGAAVYGEPVSLKSSRGETVVSMDCGGETVNVVLSEVTDFTLD